MHKSTVRFDLTLYRALCTLLGMSEQLNIRELREKLGWSQDQLGDFCGVDRTTVSRWEKEPPVKGPALILLRHLIVRSESSEPANPDGHLQESGLAALEVTR